MRRYFAVFIPLLHSSRRIFLRAVIALSAGTGICFAQPVPSTAVENSRIGTFSDARALSFSADGKMSVIDGGTGGVVILGPSGEVERSVNGKGWGQLEFDQPVDVDASPTLRIYIADYGNARVQVFDNKLNYVSKVDGRSAEDDNSYRFRYPLSVAVSRHNDIFVLDGDDARIVKFDVNGILQGTFGGFDAGEGRLHRPSRIRISAQDILGVIDGNDVLFFDLYGNYLARYQGGAPITGCAPFMSSFRWMIASDSALTIIEPEVSGCRIDGNVQCERDNGISLPAPTVRDIALRENILYLLTRHDVTVYTLASRK